MKIAALSYSINIPANTQGFSKNTLQSWEIFTTKHATSYCVRHFDHCCFIALPSEAAHSTKTTELVTLNTVMFASLTKQSF
jgi:hypothetical protein